MKIRLEDNTTVTLQSGAKLSYPQKFAGDKREVYLEGAAFFELHDDARRPFYVCNNNLVARLQGSSFAVNADRLHKKIAVTVSHGQVEVYDRTDH